MSKNKHVNLQLKYCTLLPTFVCLNTWSLFLDISLCLLFISLFSYLLTRRFITAFTSAHHLSLPSVSQIQSIPPNPTCPFSVVQVVPGYQSRSGAFLAMIRNRIRFNDEELLAPRPNPKLEDHPLSAVRYCLFNIFTSTLYIGGRSSICNLRTSRASVTGTD